MKTDTESASTDQTSANTLRSQADHGIITGYIFLALSSLIFVISECAAIEVDSNDMLTLFVPHYLLAIGYWAYLIYKNAFGLRKSWQRQNIGKTTILINLFLISAYALNREIPVFDSATDWLCAYLVVTSLTLLSYQYYHHLPKWVNYVQHFIMGSACLLYIYQIIYEANFYAVGLLGIIFFGVGAHVLAPLIMLTGIFFIIRYYSTHKFSYLWLYSGSIATAAFVAGFMAVWHHRVSAVNKMVNQSIMYSNEEELPIWVRVSQSVSADWITQRILKSDLVYTIPNQRAHGFLFFPATNRWDEKRKHDPLVFLANLTTACTLNQEDRIKILRVILDARHKSEERLWTGVNLTTAYIVSDIDIYPDLRLAYTEKYLNIKNNAVKKQWRGAQQEAIYTFQLPEGSVVTSLSLWINGKEEKGILTAKQKADNAYKTIVGVDARDPSVVHWQEGNTVTVSVFPCTTDEERKFKIGITTPLTENEQTLRYSAISFTGPDPSHAQETIRVRFPGTTAPIEMPGNFTRNSHGDFISEQPHNPDFEIVMPAVPIKRNNTFTFNGVRYTMMPYEPTYQPLTVNKIYLDLNNTWTNNEIQDLSTLSQRSTLYVCTNNGFVKLTNKNWHLVDELRKQNFSLFPFHRIKDINHALVITKGKPLSPHLIDIKESDFAIGISNFFKLKHKVFVYNLNNTASTYINSLREFRAFQYAAGSAGQLVSWLKDHKYPVQIENENSIVLTNAKMVITSEKITDIPPANNAPDHVARLFAYNHIMQKIGTTYFNNTYGSEALVDEAQNAYIVSPVSSLIVLETQKDYDRFDIHNKDNSLLNASKQSSGAVPEPHEWALIILFVAFVIYVRFKHFG